MDSTKLALFGEVALNIAGVGIICRIAFERAVRKLRPEPALADWNLPAADFLLFLALSVMAAFIAPALLNLGMGRSSIGADSRIVFNAAAMDAGVLAGAAIFYAIVCKWRPAPPRKPFDALITGASTFLVAVPILNVVTLAWQAILDWCGVGVQKQDMVDLLLNTHSSVARNILIVLAIVVAPVTEEVLFRAGMFRFLRTYLPGLAVRLAAESPGKRPWLAPRAARALALLLPAAVFGSAHASLSFFPPLLVLGVIFSLAYERTGRIGTTIVAHGLFNLNTIVLVFAGLTS